MFPELNRPSKCVQLELEILLDVRDSAWADYVGGLHLRCNEGRPGEAGGGGLIESSRVHVRICTYIVTAYTCMRAQLFAQVSKSPDAQGSCKSAPRLSARPIHAPMSGESTSLATRSSALPLRHMMRFCPKARRKRGAGMDPRRSAELWSSGPAIYGIQMARPS